MHVFEIKTKSPASKEEWFFDSELEAKRTVKTILQGVMKDPYWDPNYWFSISLTEFDAQGPRTYVENLELFNCEGERNCKLLFDKSYYRRDTNAALAAIM